MGDAENTVRPDRPHDACVPHFWSYSYVKVNLVDQQYIYIVRNAEMAKQWNGDEGWRLSQRKEVNEGPDVNQWLGLNFVRNLQTLLLFNDCVYY